MNPRWKLHIWKGYISSNVFATELPNGLYICKCAVDGYLELEPGDFTSAIKCPYCFGLGQIPRRVLRQIN